MTSYCGNELRKYTSYRAHASAVNPTDNAVRQMLVNDRGVVSLSARGLHFSIRRGLSQWNIQFVNPLPRSGDLFLSFFFLFIRLVVCW